MTCDFLCISRTPLGNYQNKSLGMPNIHWGSHLILYVLRKQWLLSLESHSGMLLFNEQRKLNLENYLKANVFLFYFFHFSNFGCCFFHFHKHTLVLKQHGFAFYLLRYNLFSTHWWNERVVFLLMIATCLSHLLVFRPQGSNRQRSDVGFSIPWMSYHS